MEATVAAQSAHRDAQALALAQACNALWSATLQLMVAFMHTQAPAHRYLLAKRIARNFATLRDEHCYTGQTRESFERLAQRWGDKAARLSPHNEGRPTGGLGIVPALLKLLGAR